VTNGLDLNAEGEEYLSFEPQGHSIRALYRDEVTNVSIPVNRGVYLAIVAFIKCHATGK
jgi:hypothetical protein